jgi:hypothetical protein
MSNVILVESKNDQIFFQALVNSQKITDTEIESSECNYEEIEYSVLPGIDPNKDQPTKLITRLKEIKTEINKRRHIKKIGVIIDIDNAGAIQRLEMINKALLMAFELRSSSLVKNVNELVSFEILPKYSVQFCCYFTNIEEKGNLDTLLRKIAKHPNPDYADCLEAWRKCLLQKGRPPIKEAEFDKIWLNNYIRFDTCDRNDQKQADKNCSMRVFEKIMQKDIFDLSSPYLDELKEFFNLFK